MIQIKRSRCPPKLEKSKSKKAYRLRSVVKALWRMQHGKCCYCEAKIPEQGHGQTVEHYYPKRTFCNKKNTWENLLLACGGCNGRKGSEFPQDESGEPLIIDPSKPGEDPESHLHFNVDLADVELWGLIAPKGKSRKGDTTINVIGLNEPPKPGLRRRRIRDLISILLCISDAREHGDIALLSNWNDHMRSYLSAKTDYSAVGRAFARRHNLDAAVGLDIPCGAEE